MQEVSATITKLSSFGETVYIKFIQKLDSGVYRKGTLSISKEEYDKFNYKVGHEMLIAVKIQ